MNGIRWFSCLAVVLLLTRLASSSEAVLEDARLDKRVTIECADMRLNAALDEVSKQTGVTLRCGTNRDDRQVREIPVTICAKDIPLGKLLDAIAASTHLLLSTEKAGDSKVYRIWRDKKRQVELDQFFKLRDDAQEQWAKWEWDAMAKYQDVPDNMLGADPRDPDHTLARALSKLTASLGTEWRDRIMDGETLKLGLPNAWPSLQEALKDLFKAEFQTHPASQSEGNQLTDESLQKYVIGLYLDETGLIRTPIKNPFGRTTYYSLNTVAAMGILDEGRKAAGLSASPRLPEPSDIEDEQGEYKALKRKADWDLPALKRKVTLLPPEGKKELTCADALSALSSASGYSIICEDFESHRTLVKVDGIFTGETTLGTALRALDRYTVSWDKAGFIWYVNEKDELILGSANMWPYHHVNLVSESLLNSLRAKLNGDGIGLDDYISVLRLSNEQTDEWVSNSPDLRVLTIFGHPASKDLWLLYGSLDSGAKSLAQSEAGLPLRNLPPQLVVDAVQKHNSIRDRALARDLNILTPYQEGQSSIPIGEPYLVPDPLPSDPEQLKNCVMRIRKRLRLQHRQSFTRSEDFPLKEGYLWVDSYDMELATQDGRLSMRIDGPTPLPIYSPEREKALGIEPMMNPAQMGPPATNPTAEH